MRSDEEYAKNSIKVYLEKHLSFVGNIIEGENPPDYYVIKNNKKIALEITTAESIYNNEDKKNRRTSTESVAKYCDELNNEFKKLIPPRKSLMLALKIPILNFSKFKKQLKTILKNFLQEDEMFNKSLNINGEIVEAKWIPRPSDNLGAVRGLIEVKNFPIELINLQNQTHFILERIIRGKKIKLSKIKVEKWLGVINNHPFLDHNIFIQTMRIINNNHGFSKIFIIGRNSEIFEIQKITN